MQSIHDTELGDIAIKTHWNARKATARITGGHIVITIPASLTGDDVRRIIETHRTGRDDAPRTAGRPGRRDNHPLGMADSHGAAGRHTAHHHHAARDRLHRHLPRQLQQRGHHPRSKSMPQKQGRRSPARHAGTVGKTTRIQILGSQDKLGQQTMGQLQQQGQHQPLGGTHDTAAAPRRVCPAPRTLPHKADEPRQGFQRPARQMLRRADAGTRKRTKATPPTGISIPARHRPTPDT